MSTRTKRAAALGCAAAIAVGGAMIADSPVEAGGWWRQSSQPRISIGDATANEADGSIAFDVTLDRASNRTVRAFALTRSGSARVRQDFDWTLDVVSFAPGETEATFEVPLIDDDVEETVEQFRARLLFSIGARPADRRAVGTIEDNDGPLSINLIHVNDHHSHLAEEDGDLDLGTSVGEFEHVLGGFPRVVTKIDELASTLENPVKIHAGDAVTGTLFYSLFKGEADAALMNEVCFDMFALGNHEFDDSDAGLANFLGFLNADPSVCDTPVLAANVVPAVGTPLAPTADESLIQPYVIKEFDGQKVGFVGLDIAQKTQVSSSPLETTQFLDEVATAQAKVDELAAMGVDNVVLVTHQGYDNDLALASQVTGVDAIVGGDSHSLLGNYGPLGLNSQGDYPTIATNADGDTVCVVQAWQYSYVVGELNIVLDDGKVQSCGGNPHLLVDEPFIVDDLPVEGEQRQEILDAIDANPLVSLVSPDPDAQAVLDTFSGQVDVLQQTVIGSATEDLCLERIPGQGRSAICAVDAVSSTGAVSNVNGGFIQQIVTDAFAARAFRADFALQNAGGVRIDIPAGDVTIGDVYTLLPFANTLVELELTGAEVELVLEQAITNFADNGGSSGSYPYGSKLRWNVDLSQSAGNRVSGVEVKQGDGTWVAIDPVATYVVATNSFIASGRDGYLAFGVAFDEGRVVDTFIDYAQGFIDFLEQDAGGVLTVPDPSDFSTQSFTPAP